MTSPFGDTGNTRLFLVWVTAFWSHHRQVTSKSYVGPYYLGNTLQRPAHSTAISSVLILQWGPCCLMLPDGYMKDKFPKPKKFLGIVQFPFPTHSPHPPPFCQIWIKTVKKKKVKSSKLSPSKRSEHSLHPSLMSLSLKRSWQGLRNKIGDGFLSRRYATLSPRGVIYLDTICCLLRTDLRKMAFWSPPKHK